MQLFKNSATRFSLYLVVILIISILGICIPVYGNSYTLTVSPDASNYAAGTQVNISGTLTDITTQSPTAGLLVSIKVTDPYGDNVYSTIVKTNSAGKYSTSFISQFGINQPTGIYSILANAASNGNSIAIARATYTVTASKIPTISVSPAQGSAGFSVMITGTGFAGSSTISVAFDGISQTTTPSMVTSSSSGSVTCSFMVPYATTGVHIIQVTDSSSNSASAIYTVTNSTVTPTPTPTVAPTPSPSPSPIGWSAGLTSTQSGYSDTCTFGVRNDATYDFNAAYDQVKSPLPPQGVYSYFNYPSNPTSPVNLQKLGTSIVGPWPADNASWTYQVKAVGADGPLVISWSNIGAIPSTYVISLLNATNGETIADMRQTYSYSFQAAADVTYTFTVEVTTNTQIMLNLSPGWNMVSFQMIPSNSSFSSISSNVGYYQVLSWDGNGYVTPTTAEAGKGYWILVLKTANIILTGQPVNSYQLNAQPGWNVIGSINGKSVNAYYLFSGQFYQLLTWNGSQYVTATAIEPGKSYWLLVTTPTNVTVS